MKKLKALLAAALACVFALGLSALFGCAGSYELQSIQLDTSAVKTEYAVGEEFTSDGLKVTAVRTNSGNEETVDVPLAEVTIDSSDFQSVEGEYTITVSYTLNNVTKSANYTVMVVASSDTTFVNMEVNTDQAKTAYYIGDELSYEGLVVTATLRITGGGVRVERREIDIDDIVIDSSAFNNQSVGEYEIKLSYTAYGTTRETSYTVTVDLPVRIYRLILDVSGIQTLFDAGEEFNCEGLKATAFDYDYINNTAGDPYDVTQDIIVDSSAYNAGEVGDYDIVVTCTKDGYSVQATYTVRVITAAGLVLEVPEDGDTYTFTSSGVEIDISNIKVYAANANGKYGDPITEGLTFKAYLGSAENEYTVTNGKFVADKAGVYNIWVYYQDFIIPGTGVAADIDGFTLLYVMDELTGITLNDTSVTTQVAGSDVISDTWTFTATYSSGVTKQLTAEDVVIEGLATALPIQSATATVTYTETDSKGVQVTMSTQVTYTITASTGEAVNVLVGSTEISALPTQMTGETKLNDFISILADSKNTVTVDNNEKTYAEDTSKTFTHRLKLGGTGTADYRSVKLTIASDNATIIVYCLSSNSGSDRALNFNDSTFTTLSSGVAAGKPDTGVSKLVFTADEAGIYYLASASSGINIYGIEIVYN